MLFIELKAHLLAFRAQRLELYRISTFVRVSNAFYSSTVVDNIYKITIKAE